MQRVLRLDNLFPKPRDKADYDKLKIDDESVSYISTHNVAQQITDIVAFHLDKLLISSKRAVVTDATAGVGGNTISFAKYFNRVNAIEMDQLRYEYLVNNIGVYRLRNVTTFNGDCLKFLYNLDHNAVFLDPPWGGKDYKAHQKLHLFLSNVDVEDIINKIIGGMISPELIVMKVPKNFDLEHMYHSVESNKIFLYRLKKMNIVVIENEKQINRNLQTILDNDG